MKKLLSLILMLALLVLVTSNATAQEPVGGGEEAEEATEQVVEEVEESVGEPVEEPVSEDAGEAVEEAVEEEVDGVGETVSEPVDDNGEAVEEFEPVGDPGELSAAQLDDGDLDDSAIPGAPEGGTTGVQVVNIGSSAANVQAVYYAEDGTQYTLPSQTLDNFGSSYTYFAEPSNEQSFSGAGILSSDQAIAAVVNTAFSSNKGAAYEGSAGSTEVLLPLVVRGFADVVSIIGIQNTDTTASVQVEVEFVPQGASSFTKNYTVQAGASQIIDLAQETGFNSDEWIGLAIVRPVDGSTPVAASVMNYSANFVYSYTGASETSDTNYLPLIRSGFAGNLTGISVVDANTANDGDTTITVEYSGAIYAADNQTGAPIIEDYTCTVQATLPDNESIVFYNSGATDFTTIFGGSDSATVTGGTCQTNNHANFDATGGLFLGSAKVTATGTNAAIASIVNDQSTSGISSGAYTGFLSSQAGSRVVSPLARNNFAGTTSGTQIQNISTNEVTIVATYATSSLSNNTSAPPSKQVTLAPGQSTTFFLPIDWGSGSSETGWLGSVSVNVASGNGQIVGITNDSPAGDASLFSTILAP